MTWKDRIKHGFIAGILGVVIFGLLYLFGTGTWSFRQNPFNIIADLPIIVLPPMGLFWLMSRKKKAAPSVVSSTPPPRVILNETPLDKLKRLESETPTERIERIRKEAAEALKPKEMPPVETPMPAQTQPRQPVEPQAKAPVTGYCVKCKAERVIVEPKNDKMKNGRGVITGLCPEPKCGTQIFRIGEMNGHAENEVPIPFTITLAGVQHEFEYGISPTELISKGKRKGGG